LGINWDSREDAFTRLHSIANEDRKKVEMTTTAGAAVSLATAFGSELRTEESKGSYSLSSSTSFARPLMDMPVVQQRLKIDGRRGAVRINGLAQLLHLPKSGSDSKRMQVSFVFFCIYVPHPFSLNKLGFETCIVMFP
jgi:hypothetical protein